MRRRIAGFPQSARKTTLVLTAIPVRLNGRVTIHGLEFSNPKDADESRLMTRVTARQAGRSARPWTAALVPMPWSSEPAEMKVLSTTSSSKHPRQTS